MSSKQDFCLDSAELDSTFDEDEISERKRKLQSRYDLTRKEPSTSVKRGSYAQFTDEVTRDEGRRQRFHLLSLNAYDRHKKLVNDYLLYYPGSTARVNNRDSSRDKRDIDVIRENHRFLWNDDYKTENDEGQLSWGQKLAKKYYEKLFKEYCICDLSRYKENKVAMRWRVEKEVVAGKGQFECGGKKCGEKETLRTWEVNFAYVESGEKKNALVKVRLCPDCSYKLNYYHKKKEIVKNKREKKKKRKNKRKDDSDSDEEFKAKKKKFDEEEQEKKMDKKAKDIWSKPLQVEQEKTRDEDFSEYLEDLFL